MKTSWDQRYAQRIQHMKSSAIRELLKVTEIPGMISFAGGLPAPEVFPVKRVAAVTQRILSSQGPQALQYSATEGYLPLRELIAQRVTRSGVRVSSENILITSGSQQGLDLLAKILVDPDDRVACESPTYMGALQACNAYQPRYLTVPSDEDGIMTDRLEEVLQRDPKFLYTLPNFQNPSGVTYTSVRRKRLIGLTERYETLVIEDDPYSQLRFEGEELPSLLSLAYAREHLTGELYEGHVIYLGTFSKVLAPGLRLGWIVAPTELLRKLVMAKQGADLHTSTLNQMIAYEMTHDGFVDEHVEIIRDTYRQRRNTMLASLEEYFPEDIHWTRPQGGMFLWVTLPEGTDSSLLLKDAFEYQVAFVPGEPFHPEGGGMNTMRLSFSNATPEKIEEGIGRLGRMLHKRLAQRV